MDLEDEEAWLRHRVLRLRTILRMARQPDVETALRVLIGEGEARLEVLTERRLPTSPEQWRPVTFGTPG
jgi:hypothetical protein